MTITQKNLLDFKMYLISEEKSGSTLESYLRNVETFMIWLNDEDFDKKKVIEYKEFLITKYKISTANAVLSAINAYLEYSGRSEYKVKIFRKQKEIFYSENKELTKTDYEKLLDAAYNKKNKRIFYEMQAICATGIRVSELKYITVESLKNKCFEVRCKGKNRIVFFPESLCRILTKYAAEQKLETGSVFVTRTGIPVNRSVIWREMKSLCKEAGVLEEKVYPHNLRHLFARIYYSSEKDIVRLADILGHTSVNTTRVYTMESGTMHRKQIEKMGLVIEK